MGLKKCLKLRTEDGKIYYTRCSEKKFQELQGILSKYYGIKPEEVTTYNALALTINALCDIFKERFYDKVDSELEDEDQIALRNIRKKAKEEGILDDDKLVDMVNEQDNKKVLVDLTFMSDKELLAKAKKLFKDDKVVKSFASYHQKEFNRLLTTFRVNNVPPLEVIYLTKTFWLRSMVMRELVKRGKIKELMKLGLINKKEIDGINNVEEIKSKVMDRIMYTQFRPLEKQLRKKYMDISNDNSNYEMTPLEKQLRKKYINNDNDGK